MAEGARLESVYTRKRIEGSNPSLTAILKSSISGNRWQAWCFSPRPVIQIAVFFLSPLSFLDMLGYSKPSLVIPYKVHSKLATTYPIHFVSHLLLIDYAGGQNYMLQDSLYPPKI